MTRVLFFFLTAAIAAVLAVGSAQAQLAHRYSFDDLTDSVGDADGVGSGDFSLGGGQLFLNLTGGATPRDGLINLLANGASGININEYSGTTIEFWAAPNCSNLVDCAPNANDGFSTAVAFGKVNGLLPGAAGNYVIMQTHRGTNPAASRGAISIDDDDAPWGSETGVDGPEHDDGNTHHYALVISGTDLSWYVDGVSSGTALLSATNMLSGVSNQRALIGDAYPDDQNWSGLMDELRIYNQAASAEYIANSRAAGPGQLTTFIPQVPEPATLCLALIGLCGLAARRRRS